MNTQPNWDGEFDKLVDQLRKAFVNNRVQDFLTIYQKLNSLFTTKLQAFIDRKDHFIEEYNFNVDPNVLKRIDDFNNNFNNLITNQEQIKQELDIKKLTESKSKVKKD